MGCLIAMFEGGVNRPRHVGMSNAHLSSTLAGSTDSPAIRHDQLLKTFSEIDVDGNKFLSFEEIQAFLSKRIGVAFDEELLRELFRNLDKDHNSVVTAEEFVGSYVEAERLVAERVATVERELEENKAQLEKTLTEKRSADVNERMNQNGLMEGSILTVHVIQAENLKVVEKSAGGEPAVELACEGQRIETKAAKDPVSPNWDEKFTFSISQGSDDLKLTVWGKGKSKRDFEGQLAIPLTLIRDQMMHEEWFELQPQKKGERWQGRIHISLQWVWSRRVYFEEMGKQWQAAIDEDMDQLRSLRLNLQKLREPFGAGKQGSFSAGDANQTEVRLNQKPDILVPFVNDMDWSNTALLVTVLLVLVSALTCFSRSDLMGVIAP